MRISLENRIKQYQDIDVNLYEVLNGLLTEIKALDKEVENEIFNEPLVVSANQHVAADFQTNDATAWNVVGVATQIFRSIQISKDKKFAKCDWSIHASTLAAATPTNLLLRIPGNYGFRGNDQQSISQAYGIAWIFNAGVWQAGFATLGDTYNSNYISLFQGAGAVAFAAGALWVKGSISFPIAVNE
jgi:hypothetical protein